MELRIQILRLESNSFRYSHRIGLPVEQEIMLIYLTQKSGAVSEKIIMRLSHQRNSLKLTLQQAQESVDQWIKQMASVILMSLLKCSANGGGRRSRADHCATIRRASEKESIKQGIGDELADVFGTYLLANQTESILRSIQKNLRKKTSATRTGIVRI